MLNMNKVYRIVVLGRTGSGKSQLCNFIIKDKKNQKYVVSELFDSQTKEPQIEYFIRKVNDRDIEIELIDTAGWSDSSGKDEENFKILINKLKEKKSVDLFLLLFNFEDARIDNNNRGCIKFIANTFTSMEFYNHLAIIFTNYKENPSKKDIAKKEKKTKEIIKLIKETIGMIDIITTFIPNIYELDTQTDDNDNFIPKFQATIDIILLRMQTMIDFNGPINTENIKYNGVKDRIKEEKEKLEKLRIELLEKEKNIEIERKKNEEDKQKNEQEKKRLEGEKNNLNQEMYNNGWGGGGYIGGNENDMSDALNREKYVKKIEKENEIEIRPLNELKNEKSQGLLTMGAGLFVSCVGGAGSLVGTGAAASASGIGAILGVPIMIYGCYKYFKANKEIEAQEKNK